MDMTHYHIRPYSLAWWAVWVWKAVATITILYTLAWLTLAL